LIYHLKIYINKIDFSNNITIDLSSYVLKTNFDLSFKNLQNNKQDDLTFTTPLKKDVSNNIKIDLSTSTTILGYINSLSTFSKLNVDNLNATSTMILDNLNSLSNNSILSINNLNATYGS
jgi:hypothetical protein